MELKCKFCEYIFPISVEYEDYKIECPRCGASLIVKESIYYKEDQTNICSICGAPLPLNVDICKQCGNLVKSAVEVPVEVLPSIYKVREKEKTPPLWRMSLAFILILFIISLSASYLILKLKYRVHNNIINYINYIIPENYTKIVFINNFQIKNNFQLEKNFIKNTLIEEINNKTKIFKIEDLKKEILVVFLRVKPNKITDLISNESNLKKVSDIINNNYSIYFLKRYEYYLTLYKNILITSLSLEYLKNILKKLTSKKNNNNNKYIFKKELLQYFSNKIIFSYIFNKEIQIKDYYFYSNLSQNNNFDSLKIKSIGLILKDNLLKCEIKYRYNNKKLNISQEIIILKKYIEKSIPLIPSKYNITLQQVLKKLKIKYYKDSLIFIYNFSPLKIKEIIKFLEWLFNKGLKEIISTLNWQKIEDEKNKNNKINLLKKFIENNIFKNTFYYKKALEDLRKLNEEIEKENLKKLYNDLKISIKNKDILKKWKALKDFYKNKSKFKSIKELVEKDINKLENELYNKITNHIEILKQIKKSKNYKELDNIEEFINHLNENIDTVSLLLHESKIFNKDKVCISILNKLYNITKEDREKYLKEKQKQEKIENFINKIYPDLINKREFKKIKREIKGIKSFIEKDPKLSIKYNPKLDELEKEEKDIKMLFKLLYYKLKNIYKKKKYLNIELINGKNIKGKIRKIIKKWKIYINKTKPFYIFKIKSKSIAKILGYPVKKDKEGKFSFLLGKLLYYEGEKDLAKKYFEISNKKGFKKAEKILKYYYK